MRTFLNVLGNIVAGAIVVFVVSALAIGFFLGIGAVAGAAAHFFMAGWDWARQ